MPLVGLMSDSHGRADRTRRGVQILLEHGTQVLLHLGDIGGIEVIDALVAVPPRSADPVKAHLVFGNCDWDTGAMARYAVDLGVQVNHPVGRLNLGGDELVFMHGHDHQAMADALKQRVRWLCHGHSHETLDRRQGTTRVINPGALQRATTYTVALLKTDTDHLVFLPVRDSE